MFSAQLTRLSSVGPALVLALAGLAFVAMVLITPATSLSQRVENEAMKAVSTPILIPKFADKTLDADISFVHQQGEETVSGIDDVLGPGACAFDFDNDGWVDLFLVNGLGQTRYYGKPYWWQGAKGSALLKNINGQRFEDVSEKAGFSESFVGMGCISSDFDNDGDADLLITSFGKNLLYRNDGNGSFANVTDGSGIDGEHWSTSATVADFNHDGLLDVYIANYVSFRKGVHTYEPGSQFSGEVPTNFQGSFYEPQRKLLYQNLGNLRFKDVTDEMNVDNGDGRTLGVAWGDLNDDGWQDLVLANDKGVASNAVLINDKGKGFSAGNIRSGIHSSAGHHGLSLGDIDNDGDMDVVFSSDKNSAPLVLIKDNGTSPVYSDKARDVGIDAEYFSGLSGWTTGLFDFNNDGWLDLFISNGLLMPDSDIGRVPLGQPKHLWINSGKLSFSEISKETGNALSDAQSARGSVFADFDNDGDIDVYVAHNNDLGQLLINELAPGNHWLGLKLEGATGNRDAIGSKITLSTESGTQTRFVVAGNGFLSDSDRRVNFGLDKASFAKRLTIQWPDGEKTEMYHLMADHYYRIRQGEKAVVADSVAAPARPVSLKLVVGENDPANRISYLQILAATSGIETALPELEAALQDTDATVRVAVIDLLMQYKTAHALKLLTHGLEDTNPAVAVKAIDGLCAYEDESSVRWLLRAFKSPQPEVRVKLSECFAYLYQEEEAVIHRKYLALPYLIRLLQDDQPTVRMAAARALANAERYRAVQPLVDKLSDPQPLVRAEAVRALGLIREGKAISAILGILKSHEQIPKVYAQALIALKRLAYPDFAKIQKDFIFGSGSFDGLPVVKRLLTVRYLFDDKDEGVVLDQDELIDLVIAWSKLALADILKERAGETAVALINVLIPASRPQAIDILTTLRNHELPKVRAEAIGSLLAADQQNQTQYINAGLDDPSAIVRLKVLDALSTIKLTGSLPEQRLLQALESPETRLAAIICLARIGSKTSGARLYALATNLTETPETIGAAITSLTQYPSSSYELPGAIVEHSDARVRKAAFGLWLSRQPSFIETDQMPERFVKAFEDTDASVQWAACQALLGRREAWAMRKVEAEIAEPNGNQAVRSCLLDKYKLSTLSSAGRHLIKSTQFEQDPLREKEVVNLLRSADQASDPFAWQLLKDKAEAPRIRLIAAKALSPRYGKEVIEWLKGARSE